MKKSNRWLTTTVLILAAASLPARQATTDEFHTLTPIITGQTAYKFSNGKMWRLDFDRQAKVMWVDGMEEGMMLLMREVYGSGQAEIESQVKELMIRGFRMSDVVEQIDRFYGDSSNLRIPTVDAYKFAMKKMHGANQQELENYQAKLRQTYNH